MQASQTRIKNLRLRVLIVSKLFAESIRRSKKKREMEEWLFLHFQSIRRKRLKLITEGSLGDTWQEDFKIKILLNDFNQTGNKTSATNDNAIKKSIL